MPITHLIRLAFGVLASIEFDDETVLKAGKISDVRADRHLPFELDAVKPFRTQEPPQPLLVQSDCDEDSALRRASAPYASPSPRSPAGDSTLSRERESPVNPPLTMFANASLTVFLSPPLTIN
jgi:hypothetical protein